MVLTFNGLCSKLKNKDIYLFIGNSALGYRYKSDLNKVMKKACTEMSDNSTVIYFGDSVDKLTIGYCYKYISEHRKDIDIYMINIMSTKKYSYPKFVKGTYYHNDYKKCSHSEYGGIDKNGQACSNTKKWLSIHKKFEPKGYGIKKIYFLGGGKISYQEYKVAKKNKIPYEYHKLQRRFRDDRKTRIRDKDTNKIKYGYTFKKIR